MRTHLVLAHAVEDRAQVVVALHDGLQTRTQMRHHRLKRLAHFKSRQVALACQRKLERVKASRDVVHGVTNALAHNGKACKWSE